MPTLSSIIQRTALVATVGTVVGLGLAQPVQTQVSTRLVDFGLTETSEQNTSSAAIIFFHEETSGLLSVWAPDRSGDAFEYQYQDADGVLKGGTVLTSDATGYGDTLRPHSSDRLSPESETPAQETTEQSGWSAFWQNLTNFGWL